MKDWRPLLLALASLSALSLFLWGNAVWEMLSYMVGVHRLADPSLYPGDANVDFVLALPFWSLYPFAWADRLGVLDQVLFAGTLLARLALVAAAIALARGPLRLDPQEAEVLASECATSPPPEAGRASWVAGAALLLAAAPTWGAVGLYRLIGAEPTQVHLAIPLPMAALGLACRGRALPAGLLAGLGFVLHPTVTAAALPSLAAILWCVSGDRRADLARLAGSFGLVAAPMLVWIAARGTADLAAVSLDEAYRLVRLTSGAHLFFGDCSLSAKTGLYLSAAALVACWSRTARPLVYGAAAALALAALNVTLVGLELAPVWWLKGHFLRATLWSSALTRVALGFAVVELARSRRLLAATAGGLLAAGLVAEAHLVTALGVAALAGGRARAGALPAWVGLSAGIAALAFAASARGPVSAPLLRAAALAAACVAACALVRRRGAASTPWVVAAATVAGALTLRVSVAFTGHRLASLSLDLPRLAWRPEHLHPPAHVALARWAAEETPRDARFLVNPSDVVFLGYSRRSVVARANLAGFGIWDVAGASERLTRLEAVGFGSGPLAYQVWPADRIMALALRFDVDYVVLMDYPGGPRLPARYTVAYRHGGFVVYATPRG
jgi:hypothetical protein